MSELLDYLKEMYVMIKEDNFLWYNYYPNNMPCNRKEGIYTYFWIKRDDKYVFNKYTIQYMSRCDEDGLSHPEEGTKYYVVHELVINDLDEKLKIPAPDDYFQVEKVEGYFSPNIVNEFGRFRYVFDDEETAKKVLKSELLHAIYPHMFILSDKEGEEWNKFVEEYERKNPN